MTASPLTRRRALQAACLAPVALTMRANAAARRFDGANVIVKPGYPFGSDGTRRSLTALRRLGANAVAIVPFLWQTSPTAGTIVRGDDMSDAELATAIRLARELGLAAIVKPHVWVPGSWAGAVAPGSEEDWLTWFAAYEREIVRIARIAAAEGAEAFAVGTELAQTSGRPEWNPLNAAARAAFPRLLFYVAHNADEAERVPFWPQLDAIGVSLYPQLGADEDRAGRLAAMRAATDRLGTLASRANKPVIVAEIGLRSAQGATVKPWESAEERVAAPALALQAQVIGDWFDTLARPFVQGVLVWRWFTDPAAGGLADTDFTVQGKPAERVLACAWNGGCGG